MGWARGILAMGVLLLSWTSYAAAQSAPPDLTGKHHFFLDDSLIDQS